MVSTSMIVIIDRGQQYKFTAYHCWTCVVLRLRQFLYYSSLAKTGEVFFRFFAVD